MCISLKLCMMSAGVTVKIEDEITGEGIMAKDVS